MNRLIRNQDGFTVVEIVLGLVLLGTIGLLGYFAIQNNQKNAVKIASDKPTPTASASPPPSIATAGWAEYLSEKEGLRFKYPKDWALKHFEQSNDTNYDSFTITSPHRYAILVEIQRTVIDGGCDGCEIKPTHIIEELKNTAYGKSLYLIQTKNGMLIGNSPQDFHGAYKSKIPGEVNRNSGSENWVKISTGTLLPDGTFPVPRFDGNANPPSNAEYEAAKTILRTIHYDK